jgi:hypothetical protein
MTPREIAAQLAKPWSNAREIANATAGLGGADLIAWTLLSCHWFQKDLAEASGLHPATIRAIREGRKPTKAQRAAILWAAARHLSA